MSNQQTGTLTIISGFSGSGKGSVVRELMKQYPERFVLSISMTTRKPRPGEREGADYFFVSPERFEDKIRAGGLLEHARYDGNYYGTPRDFVEEHLSRGRNVILEIERAGAFQVKSVMPRAVSIFLCAPSVEDLIARLRGRGESEAFIRARLARSAQEAAYISSFDHLVINETLSRSTQDICAILAGSYPEPAGKEAFIADIQKQLEPYRKEDI